CCSNIRLPHFCPTRRSSDLDEEGNELDVIHNGVEPDNFSDDVIVIVHGYILDNGVFEAERVQTRCPSSYEGEDMEDYDSEFHREDRKSTRLNSSHVSISYAV